MPLKAPSVITTTRCGPWRLRNVCASSTASFTGASASVADNPSAARRSPARSFVKGWITRGCAAAPMIIIRSPAPSASMRRSSSPRAASQREPDSPAAFMLALRSITTTRSRPPLPTPRSAGHASAVTTAAAVRSCRISGRLRRQSQPRRRPTGLSRSTFSSRKSAVTGSRGPLGRRLLSSRMSGTAPSRMRKAAGKNHSIGG